MFSKEEQELIDRLKASGRTLNEEKLNAPFKLMVRPLTTVGVSSLKVMSWLEDEVFAAAKDMKIQSGITAIVINPTIFDGVAAESPKDGIKFNKNDRSLFSSKNINFDAWESASNSDKINMVLINAKASLDAISDKYLSTEERKKLSHIFENACFRLIQRLLH